VLEFGQYKLIDGVPDPGSILRFGWGRAVDGKKRPVSLILRTLIDPAFQEIDLVSRQFLVGAGGRHLQIGISGEDPVDQFAGSRFSRHDRDLARFRGLCRGLFQIESQPRLSLVFIRAVALKTIVRQDRPDVAIE
jgi:hypothetical protein